MKPVLKYPGAKWNLAKWIISHTYPLQSRGTRLYAHEMTDADHVELLDALDAHPGPVLLSGYACDLYDNRLKHWRRETRRAQAEKGQAREEVLWRSEHCGAVAIEANAIPTA